jgi:NCS1 family nucleobase:cation symporter-1
MSEDLAASTFGQANIGVVIALALAGLLYYLLTAFGRRTG